MQFMASDIGWEAKERKAFATKLHDLWIGMDGWNMYLLCTRRNPFYCLLLVDLLLLLIYWDKNKRKKKKLFYGFSYTRRIYHMYKSFQQLMKPTSLLKKH